MGNNSDVIWKKLQNSVYCMLSPSTDQDMLSPSDQSFIDSSPISLNIAHSSDQQICGTNRI